MSSLVTTFLIRVIDAWIQLQIVSIFPDMFTLMKPHFPFTIPTFYRFTPNILQVPYHLIPPHFPSHFPIFTLHLNIFPLPNLHISLQFLQLYQVQLKFKPCTKSSYSTKILITPYTLCTNFFCPTRPCTYHCLYSP